MCSLCVVSPLNSWADRSINSLAVTPWARQRGKPWGSVERRGLMEVFGAGIVLVVVLGWGLRRFARMERGMNGESNRREHRWHRLEKKAETRTSRSVT
jgi:hypothetical protein